MADQAVEAALTRCGGLLTVPDARPRPLAAYLLGRAPKTIGVQGPRAARPGATLNYASPASRGPSAIGPTPPPGPPPGARLVLEERDWVATATC